METPTPTPDWNVSAERVLEFMRKYNLIIAIDKDVWLYNGTSESQLAAFLRDMSQQQQAASR